MTSQDKIDMGFDVREVPKTPLRESIRIGSKDSWKIQYPYVEKYMRNKKRPVIKEDVLDMVDNIKRKRNFKSTNDTICFLCDLEKELSKKQMIKEFAKCPDCGQTMPIDHVKKIHHHVDKDVECYGCLERSYKIGWSEDEHKAIAEAMLEREKAKKTQTDASEQKGQFTEEELELVPDDEKENYLTLNKDTKSEYLKTLRYMKQHIDEI